MSSHKTATCFRKTIAILSVAFTLFPGTLHAQADYSHDLHSPLDIPLYLSGTFGELRGNHFHSGIDIKTQGKEGLKVYAIDEGYISRIKIQSGGYGKAIYITHPNGIVSVYGHLRSFSGAVSEYAIDEQYKSESYEIDIAIPENRLKVNKGDVIAFSGNSGSSAGPHLHFEIRNEKTQHPLNPLRFKSIKIKDYYRPRITYLALYPISPESTIDGKHDTLITKVEGWGIQHRIASKEPIKVSGPVAFGIGTYDLMNDIPNKNGVYEVRLLIDSNPFFKVTMDSINFSTTRYVNSLIDYHQYKKSNIRLIRSEIDTNNILFNYDHVINNGIFEINDSASHQIDWEIRDLYGNLSSLTFLLAKDYSAHDGTSAKSESLLTYPVVAGRRSTIEGGSIRLTIPENTFYRSFKMKIDSIPADSAMLAPVYLIHSPLVPVQSSFSMIITPALSAKQKIGKEHYYLAYSDDGNHYDYAGGQWDGTHMSGSIRLLGYYTILIDTIPPSIKPTNSIVRQHVISRESLQFTIKDKETGISSYEASIDGHWVLMEYDAKTDRLFFNGRTEIFKEPKEFRLKVQDNCGNAAEFIITSGK